MKRKMERRFLVLYKDNQTYLFTYYPGQETELFCALMDYANSIEYNLDWDDVLETIEQVNEITCKELKKES